MANSSFMPPPSPQPRRKESGLGIAAFLIGLASAGLELILVIAAGVFEATTPGGLGQESTQAILLGFGMLAGLGLALLGMLLAMVALFDAERGKIFALLGLLCCGMVLAGVLLIAAIGMLAQ
jgi:hypothetical protein